MREEISGGLERSRDMATKIEKASTKKNKKGETLKGFSILP